MIFFPAILLLQSPPEGLHIPLSMLLVFATAKFLAEIFERLNQPGIIGEILAGVLLGPNILGWIKPDELLLALAELGVMFLLFRVGLEVKPVELLSLGRIAAWVAIVGVVAPLGLGYAAMKLWGYSTIESFFVGAALVATSVGITAQVLASKGWLNHRASQIILAAAVIDDVLGLLVLASVSSAAKGSVNIAAISATAILALGFVVVIALWGNKAMGRLVPRIQKTLRVAEAEYAVAMVLLFALSVLAIYIGVAAIVGAFFAGMALAGRVDTRVNYLTHGATELLVPFFLAGIGLRVDLSAFATRSTVLLSLVLVVVAVVSKFAGCGLSAYKLGRQDALRIGVGMIPRGEVGMVVAQLGLTMGVLSQPIYAVVVLMAVATTIIAPPLLKLVYRGADAESPVEDFRLG